MRQRREGHGLEVSGCCLTKACPGQGMRDVQEVTQGCFAKGFQGQGHSHTESCNGGRSGLSQGTQSSLGSILYTDIREGSGCGLSQGTQAGR